MLSRIADSMFWLNRYMERADGLLRTIRTHYILMLDKGVNQTLSWKKVLDIYTFLSDEEKAAIEYNSEAVLVYLMFNSKNSNSLKSILTRARENARGVQDHITKEVWEQVNQIYHLINQCSKDFKEEKALENIDALTKECILFNGVADTTMPRGMSWNFMSLGRYIERCLLTIEMAIHYFEDLEYDIDDEKDILFWRPLLLSLSGYELHLKYYNSSNTNQNALHQVLFNEKFTRSVLYTSIQVDKYFKDVIKNNKAVETEPVMTRRIGRILSNIQFTEFDSLNKTTLHPFLIDTRKELEAFSYSLAKQFFSYS